MTSSAIREIAAEESRGSEDLAETFGAVRLTQLALEAVGDLESPRREFRLPGGGDGYGFRMLLTLLAYAYARGVYSSVELAERIVADADLRYLATGDRPSPTELRQFRRQHGRLIQMALGRLLALAAKGMGTDGWCRGETEAARRLELAMAADSYALDC